VLLDPVAHAKSYPFPAPDHCFIYEAGGFRRLDCAVDRAGRVPVLAAGSNQSPEQLARKYGALADIGPIPAQRGRLADFDVVYAAHLASYGSVPATFQHSPGTAVTVFVLWLDARQLARMHETEGNYTYDHLTGLRIALDAGGALDEAYAYSSKVGCLNHRGGCVSLAEIRAERRRFPAFTQAEMLAAVCARLAPDIALDEFIRGHVGDGALRLARSAALRAGALPALYPRRTVLEL
jgi:hypothetical protein